MNQNKKFLKIILSGSYLMSFFIPFLIMDKFGQLYKNIQKALQLKNLFYCLNKFK